MGDDKTLADQMVADVDLPDVRRRVRDQMAKAEERKREASERAEAHRAMLDALGEAPVFCGLVFRRDHVHPRERWAAVDGAREVVLWAPKQHERTRWLACVHLAVADHGTVSFQAHDHETPEGAVRAAVASADAGTHAIVRDHMEHASTRAARVQMDEMTLLADRYHHAMVGPGADEP